jgi:hypothetical protein
MARALITGGEDGKVMQLGADGSETDLACPGPQMGRRRRRRSPERRCFRRRPHSHCAARRRYRTAFEEARTIEGLAFAPKGLRIAMARYNGVSLLS